MIRLYTWLDKVGYTQNPIKSFYSPPFWIHFGVKYDQIWLDTHEIQCDSFALCIATPASTEKVGFSNTLKKTNGIKTHSKSKFAKKPPDMKNHQNKRNKKQTNTNVEFPKFFCFCAHFFHCFCDFGFLGCFLLFALVLFFSKILYSLCWSSQNHCIQKNAKTITSQQYICYKRKKRAENV